MLEKKEIDKLFPFIFYIKYLFNIGILDIIIEYNNDSKNISAVNIIVVVNGKLFNKSFIGV